MAAGGCFGTVGALITISPLGRISGAHLDPAVSVASRLESKLAWRDAIGYIVAQLLEGAAGRVGAAILGPMGQSVQYGATRVGPGVSVWLGPAGEVLATLGLVLTI